MSVELVKTIYTYTIALVVLVGVGVLLIVPTRLASSDLLPFATSTAGFVLGFVFADRSASAGSARTLEALYTPAPPPLGPNHDPVSPPG